MVKTEIPFLDLKRQYATLSEEIANTTLQVLSDTRYILGPNVEGFEREICDYLGSRFAVGVASGSSALILSLAALGIKAGDEVITTPYTFFATSGAITHLGARPVFVDIDQATYNIDPDRIEDAITSKTRGIVPVHLFGQPADLDSILDVARRHNLFVVEDAAQAIGSEYRGRKIGTFGSTGCFSFFPSKNLGCAGDGGMVVTDDPHLADRIKALRVHGAKTSYRYDEVGWNSRLDEIQAAILRVKLPYLDDWNEARRKKAQIYDELFQGTDVVTPISAPGVLHVYNQYVVRVKRRDEVRKYLYDRGISTAIYYPLPLHLQACYKALSYKKGDFPIAEQASRETLALPLYPELTNEEQEMVSESILEYLRR
jgi:hypothetical protein